MSVETYELKSEEIETAKTGILSSLATLHDDLCALAQLERELEIDRVGVVNTAGREAIAAAVTEHLQQVQIPLQKVWGNVDESMTLIYQHNAPGTTPSHDDLPDLFKRTDRLSDFTTDQE
jgi:hypothetical protein